MSDITSSAVQGRLLDILHRAFVQGRNLALKGDCQQMYELMDTFELLPQLMAHWDESTLPRIRGILSEYDAEHPQSGYEYLSLLDGEGGACQAHG
jgi:hypothetical protein